MVGESRRYIIDASSWISIEGNPAANLILYCIGKLIEAGKIQCPPEAWDEVQKCPWVLAWLKSYREQFVKNIGTIEYYGIVGQVTHQFHVMAGARRRKERADQYIVATAVYLNAITNPTKHVVVCEESDAHRPSRKLVTACSKFNVTSINLLKMLSSEFPGEKWT
jgi:hypothetical protein